MQQQLQTTRQRGRPWLASRPATVFDTQDIKAPDLSDRDGAYEDAGRNIQCMEQLAVVGSRL
jgi:hypothetical protein